jgi:hypothetical protein
MPNVLLMLECIENDHVFVQLTNGHVFVHLTNGHVFVHLTNDHVFEHLKTMINFDFLNLEHLKKHSVFCLPYRQVFCFAPRRKRGQCQRHNCGRPLQWACKLRLVGKRCVNEVICVCLYLQGIIVADPFNWLANYGLSEKGM